MKSKFKTIKEAVNDLVDENVPLKLSRVTSCKQLCHITQAQPIIIEKSSNTKTKINKTESILKVPEATFYSPNHTRTTKATI